MYHGDAGQTSALVFNCSTVCYCRVWPAGSLISCDTQPLKVNVEKFEGSISHCFMWVFHRFLILCAS